MRDGRIDCTVKNSIASCEISHHPFGDNLHFHIPREVDACGRFVPLKKVSQMLAKLFNRLRRFVKNEDGPTTVEYSVMIMIIVLGCVTGARIIGEASNSGFEETAKGINKGLKQHAQNQKGK